MPRGGGVDVSWFDDGGSKDPVDVPALFDSGAPEVVWGIVAAGALVSIGTTSDGGALAVTVTLDGKWKREYFRDSDELVSWLLEARAAVDTGRPPASSGTAKRTRRR
jgi:hypothetical protein